MTPEEFVKMFLPHYEIKRKNYFNLVKNGNDGFTDYYFRDALKEFVKLSFIASEQFDNEEMEFNYIRPSLEDVVKLVKGKRT